MSKHPSCGATSCHTLSGDLFLIMTIFRLESNPFLHELQRIGNGDKSAYNLLRKYRVVDCKHGLV